MKRTTPSSLVGLVLILACFSLICSAQELKLIKLPAPQTSGGRPLLQLLKERQSLREYTSAKLSPQMLSTLLWAAYGINRPDGRRTAPSASNRQGVVVYVVLPDGAYLYDAKNHALLPVAAGDFRAATGTPTQDYVKNAAAVLVYVQGPSSTGTRTTPEPDTWKGADVGAIAQNVYLYCASEGLATVVRAGMDKPALTKILKLNSDQELMFDQPVGYPKK
jgi:nitroreductase